MHYSIIPISKNIHRKDFDCGIEELNRYLAQFALPNDRNNIGKTFVAVSDFYPQIPMGFYTVSMAQIKVSDLPDSIRSGLPRYPIPAMRLGKLAVDKKYQGSGIGSALLKDVFNRAISLSSEVALRFVLVDALNDPARTFYLQYGFVSLQEYPKTLVLPMQTILKAWKHD